MLQYAISQHPICMPRVVNTLIKTANLIKKLFFVRHVSASTRKNFRSISMHFVTVKSYLRPPLVQYKLIELDKTSYSALVNNLWWINMPSPNTYRFWMTSIRSNCRLR